jgi:ABC-type transport system involved in multi-copper enzyme maturation permease subunit
MIAIAKKELLNHLASFRFWIAASLTIVLASSSTLTAARDFSLRLDNYQERAANHQRTLQAATVYSYLQPLALRPPEPLSVLDQGFDPHLGTDVPIHLFAIPVEATGGHRGNEFLVSLPTVDLTTIVSVVLGLLALLLTHDAITGEREDGMLRAVLAAGVTRQAVLAGKLAGGLLAVGLPLGGGLLVSLSLFRLETGAAFTADQWLRIAGLVGVYGIYLSLMLSVGLLISLHVRSTARALSIAVLVWFITAIVIPSAAWAAARDLVATGEARRTAEQRVSKLAADHDRRLAQEFRRDRRRSVFSGHTAMSFATGEHRAVRYRNGSATYYDALAAYYRFEVRAGIQHAARIFTAQQHYEQRLQAGRRLGAGLAALSPASVLDRLSETFTGTSIGEYDRFLEACRRYRMALLEYLDRKRALESWRWFTDDPPGKLVPWPGYLGLQPEAVDATRVRALFGRLGEPGIAAQVRRDLAAARLDPARRLRLDDMPVFTYRGVDFPASLRRGAAGTGFLLMLNALVAAAAWIRFRDSDPG